MQATGPSTQQSNMDNWVMQRSWGQTPTVPIQIPTYSVDQYHELQDGMLPLGTVAFGETMPFPVPDVDDHLLIHAASPCLSMDYASSGTYSLNSVEGSRSPMSVDIESTTTYVTGTIYGSAQSAGSSGSFKTMLVYLCGSMIATQTFPWPGLQQRCNPSVVVPTSSHNSDDRRCRRDQI